MDLNNGFFVNLGTNNSSISGTEKYIPVFLTGSTIGNSKIYQDSNNNIGINTTTPTLFTGYTTFAVNGTNGGLYESQVNGITGFTLWSASGGSYLIERRNKSLYLGANNITAITIDSSQNSTFAGNIFTSAFITGNTYRIVPTSYGGDGYITFRNIANSATNWNIYNYSGGIYGSLNISTGAGVDALVISSSLTAAFSGIIVGNQGIYLPTSKPIQFDAGITNDYNIQKSGIQLQLNTGGTYWLDASKLPTSGAGLSTGELYRSGNNVMIAL